MRDEVPYGQGARMLALGELCDWLNIKERHARKLVARGAIPYRKVGRLLRFSEVEIEMWSRPKPSRPEMRAAKRPAAQVSAMTGRSRVRVMLPKSLIEQETRHAQRRSA